MRLSFWKMHGAGNDFILADDRAGRFPARDTAWLAALCARHTGIGAEGVILLQPSATADFTMRFFNPDGREAAMCGNGARCAARLAHTLGLAPPRMRIATAAGTVAAEILGESVRLSLPPPQAWCMNQSLAGDGQAWVCHSVNTGVPHVVVETTDLEGLDVAREGAALRRHPAFAPAGTNADFIAPTGAHTVRIRTYERGVEAETPACGTGAVAGALVAARLGRVTPPVRMECRGGESLLVGFRLTDAGAADVTLQGPAAYVFEGVVVYP